MKKESGFSLIELLPAILLLSVITSISMMALHMQMEFREHGRIRDSINSSFIEAHEFLKINEGSVALCSNNSTGSWIVLDFPDATWTPTGILDADSILWRRRVINEPLEMSVYEYQSFQSRKWSWWTSELIMNHEETNSGPDDL